MSVPSFGSPVSPYARRAGSVIAMACLAAALVMGCAAPEPPAAPTGPVALWRAHAHNDYAHEHPLQDALQHGFASVEADIFTINGQLLVGHERIFLDPARDLETLYLRPLQERVRQGDGQMYPHQPAPRPFILLIDFKADGADTYRRLHARLAAYRDMLSKYEHHQWRPGAVTVVLSGDRPFDLVRNQLGPRYVGLDGRIEDLDSDAPAHLLPMISASWGSVFRWRGKGEMPEAELKRLRDIVRRAHAHGRWVRFWATPESKQVWQVLLAEGVDLINTDRLADLQEFLLANDSATSRPASATTRPQ